MASVVPIPSIQDLRVIFHEKVLVSPSEKTERKSMFLSNIDQMHNYNAHTARFFTANSYLHNIPKFGLQHGTNRRTNPDGEKWRKLIPIRYSGHLDTQVFKLTPSAVNYLKDKAVTPPPLPSNKTTALSRSVNSTYNVVAALMWRCRALSSDKERVVSTLFTSMDIRSRLIPPLPDSYCGNAVLYAEASAKGGDIEKLPFSKLVELVWEGPRRFSDEYARSVIDLLEIEKWKLRPRIEYNVTSWLKLGLDQVVYPWGKPLCVGPICTVLAHACFLFPSVEGGVNASEEMQRFQAYFHQFFT